MAYWLDDGFDGWPQVVRAGTAAAGLYVRCGAWICRNSQDGFVPTEVAAMYGTPEWVAKLVAVGLWRTEEAGYVDVHYFIAPDGTKLNKTAAEVAHDKKLKRERQARWLEKAKAESRPKTVRRRSRDASQVASKDIAPSLPPLREENARTRSARAPCKTCANAMDSPYHRNICRIGKTA